MKNKFLISTLLLLLCITFLCSYSFAENTIQSASNTIKNAGNSISNAAKNTGNTLINGTENLLNDAQNIGNNAMNNAENMTNNTEAMYGANNDDYTAQRTAAPNTGLFGMSDTMSTWLILGVVGAVIVGLIWYYAAQYEHKNYNND